MLNKSKMGHCETIFSMSLLRLLNVLTLIIICILIAQLCNDNEYGYKSLNSIDSEKTMSKFRSLIEDRIQFSKDINYINLVFNFVIFFFIFIII